MAGFPGAIANSLTTSGQMHDQPQDILETHPDCLARWLESHGEPAYRLGQILDWVYGKRADSFSTMSNLSLGLRARLQATFSFFAASEIERLRSRDGATEKFLLGLHDGEQVESVWMNDLGHHTFCISSQAGCALNCCFCATGAMGFGRNLKLKEILAQVVALARANGWPANIVFMGMGEPLLNLEAVVPALESLTDLKRFGLGARHITVSTAGVTPGIRKLSRCSARAKLALSLNSPFDDQRSVLMPVNRQYPLPGVLDACREYSERTGRRIVFEYVLLGGVNTSCSTACALAGLARNLGALVNLISFNPVPQCGFHPPARDEVHLFREVLEKEGVRVTERFRRGRDIAAGCGQLKGKHRARSDTASQCPTTDGARESCRDPGANAGV